MIRLDPNIAQLSVMKSISSIIYQLTIKRIKKKKNKNELYDVKLN